MRLLTVLLLLNSSLALAEADTGLFGKMQFMSVSVSMPSFEVEIEGKKRNVYLSEYGHEVDPTRMICYKLRGFINIGYPESDRDIRAQLPAGALMGSLKADGTIFDIQPATDYSGYTRRGILEVDCGL